MKKIVTIGGGTGQYTLLKGLKEYNIDLKAIVSVADNGGSSGELRVEFGILPPGDLRNCLLALADNTKLNDLMYLFEYRFSNSNKKLSNHNLGNLILTALHHKYGNMADAVKAASEILNVSGTILPVSVNSFNLYAKTSEGEILEGEEEVSYSGKKIKELWLKPESNIYKDTAKALEEADLIIVSPGELYGSIIPNFLVKGFKESIQKSRAKIIYVCNLVKKQNTYDFKAGDFVKTIEKYLGKKIDYVICNTKKPSTKIVDKYKKEESFFIEPNLNDKRTINEDLLVEFEVNGLITARHNAEKVAKLILNLF